MSPAAVSAATRLVRAAWPQRLGTPPKKLLSGVPAHVDGRCWGSPEAAGAARINRRPDVATTPKASENWKPDLGAARHPDPARPVLPVGWTRPAAAAGATSPVSTPSATSTPSWAPGTVHVVRAHQKIIEKEFALSGSEQNPDLTGKSGARGAEAALRVRRPVEAFKQHGVDFVLSGNWAPWSRA